jgi:hypothetical protein
MDKIYSGALNFIDQHERKYKLQAFKDIVEKDKQRTVDQAQKRAIDQAASGYTLTTVADARLGGTIVEMYQGKFRRENKNRKSMCLFMVDKDIFLIDQHKITKSDGLLVSTMLGIKETIPEADFHAKLEVRIQPRGITTGKRLRVDTLASLRLTGRVRGLQLLY